MKNSVIHYSAGLLAVLLFVLPLSADENTRTPSTKVYSQVVVDGLSCAFCAYGLEKKLKNLDGMSELNIDLEKGKVTMAFPRENQPSKETLQEIVKDAGFVPREILFAEKPWRAVGSK